jgi:hypothetical protein
MIEIINCEQGSIDWLQARAGIPTASMFSALLAKGQGKTRRTYMLKLLGERLTGESAENYSNAHMERGHELEDEARQTYRFVKDIETQEVGFIRNGDKGASPDSLVGSDGLLEIKTKLPHLQLDVLFRDELPSEHIPQVQGQIWISEREWCDFVSYCPGLRPFIKRVYRDDTYIKVLADEVRRFNDELSELEQRYRSAA